MSDEFVLSVKDHFQKGFLFPERVIPLHAMIISCGYQKVDTTQYSWQGINRGNAELIVWQYTIAGRGALLYDGVVNTINPGQCMMVHIPHDHCYFLPEDSPEWEFFYICLNGREIVRICIELEKMVGPVFTLTPTSKSLAIADQFCRDAVSDGISDAAANSAYAYQLGMAMVSDLSYQVDKKTKKPEFVKNVTEFCIDHFAEPISVDDMAEIAGFSRYHFSRLFHKYQGVSPSVFLQDLRLKKAARLLQLELLSISEIAEKCGFQSSSYFCRAFQKAFGASPSSFKNQNQK